MRIVKLKVENVRRIKAATVQPTGRVVKVSGGNGEGKTSLLDSIALVLEGPGARGSVARRVSPLRIGTAEGKASVDLGEMVVTRHWSDGGATTKLVVQERTPEGLSTLKDGASILERLVGPVAFDPMRFAHGKPQDRRDELMRVSGLTDVLTDIAGRRLALYEERTIVGREADRLGGAIMTMPDVADLSEEVEPETSTAALVAEMERRQAANVAHERAAGCLRAAHAAWRAAGEKVATLRGQLAEAEAALIARADARTVAQAAMLSATSGLEDLADMEARVQEVESGNAAARARNLTRQQRANMQAEHWTADGKRRSLTAAIERVDAEKVAALRDVKLPLPELGISDEDVTYRGVPFGDVSASERIKIGLAVGAAMNPALRVAIIRDGSLLDDESMAMVEAFAEEHDLQVWVELVGDDAAGAWVIEDGSLVADASGT